jgi:Protein of unknown function (DUF3631)
MIALIGRLPATPEDHAIVLPMRRRAPGETVERIRREVFRASSIPSAAALFAGSQTACRRCGPPTPPVPGELDDRQADNWRPILAIADEAGGAGPTSRAPPLARSRAPSSKRTMPLPFRSSPTSATSWQHRSRQAHDGRQQSPLDHARGSAVGRLRPRPSHYPPPPGHAAGGIQDQGQANSPRRRHRKGYLRSDLPMPSAATSRVRNTETSYRAGLGAPRLFRLGRTSREHQ